jgi:proteasome lid subunit RPN8/RPN11
VDPTCCTWAVPECPFAIEYPAAVLDQIRLAVMDAFFAIRHGGLEIGGVLFGRYREGSLRIETFRMLECAHEAGPSFTLSDADRDRLQDLLESAAADGLSPVGWFRSRTRSHICLSEADIALYDTYFREPWQVVLVLRPEVMRPTRAGFFVRVDGRLRVDASLGEFALEPWNAAAEKPPTLPEPKFLNEAPTPRSSSRMLWIAALIVSLVGATFAGWRYLDPRTAAHEGISLEALDRSGQLQLLWDRSARSVRSASRAKLEITDGPARLSTDLEAAQLQRGSFYYARRSERVDIHLTVIGPNGRSTDEYASFLGRLPTSEREPQAKLDPAEVKTGSAP